MKKAEKKIGRPGISPPSNAYITSISSIIGYDAEANCLKLKNGYSAAINIPGIDILHYKDSDKDIAYTSWGQAIQSSTVPTKLIILSDHPSYSDQIAYFVCRRDQQVHPYRRALLDRQLRWIQHYEKSQLDRLYFVFFFGNPDTIDYSIDQYTRLLSPLVVPRRCTMEDYKHIYRLIFQGDY